MSQKTINPKKRKDVRVQTLAKTLYNIALDTYCETEGVRRQASWVWKTQQQSRKWAWLAVAKHVLQKYEFRPARRSTILGDELLEQAAQACGIAFAKQLKTERGLRRLRKNGKKS